MERKRVKKYGAALCIFLVTFMIISMAFADERNDMIYVGFLQYQSSSSELFVFCSNEELICNISQTSYPGQAGIGWFLGKITPATKISVNNNNGSMKDLKALNEKKVSVYGKSRIDKGSKVCQEIVIIIH